MALIDLNNIWQNIIASTWRIFVFAVIIVATFIAAKIVDALMKRSFKRRSAKLFKTDETARAFLRHVVTAAIYIFGIGFAIYTIPSFRTIGVSLFAGAGILAVVIGFASQHAFANIVSGIFISIFKPFRVGDRVKLATGLAGIVEDITLRHTVIRSYENIRHVMPNSKISDETIENMDLGDPKILRFIHYGVSYDADLDKAIKIIRKELQKHPDFLDNRNDEDKKKRKEPIDIRVTEWGDFSINIRAAVWSENSPASWRLKTDTLKTIKERFDKEGVEIPFPYRTLVMKKDLEKQAKKTVKKRTKKKPMKK